MTPRPWPSDWTSTTVDDLKSPVENALATGPFGSSIGSRFFQSHGVPILRGGNVRADGHTRIVDEDLVFLSETKAREFRRSIARAGDLVFTCWGTIDQVGLVDSGAAYPEYVVSNKQMKFTPDSRKADSLYLFYLFSSSEMRRRRVDQGIGSSVPGFNLGQLRATRVTLPPLSEQHAIARVLADVDALSNRLVLQIGKTRDLKQATAQALLTGRTRLLGFAGEWDTAPVGDLAMPRKERFDPSRTGVQRFCVELEHIEPELGGLIGSAETTHESSLKAVFYPRDVLFGKLRSYLRKYWLADREGVCSTEIWPLVADRRRIEPSFLYQVVRSDGFIEAASAGFGTHMPRADWRMVKAHSVCIPPLPEQAAIARVLEDLDAEIAALAARLVKTRDLKTAMSQELLSGRTRLA